MDLDAMGFPGSYVEVRASTKTSLTPVSFACRSSEAPGLWYRFTGPGTMVRIQTCTRSAAPYRSIIQVISGSCDSRMCEAYALDRNSPTTCGLGGDTVICTQQGVEYYILVEGQSKETGEFILRVRDTQLACDEGPYSPCSNALTIQADVNVPVILKDYPPVMITDCELITSPEGSRAFANAAFFRFVAPASAQYTVDLCGGSSGTFDIEVYQGECESTRCFGTSRVNDGTCPSNSEQETQTFCTTAGQTYIIVLHSGYGRVNLLLRRDGACTVPCVPVCEQGTSCVGDTCGGVCGTCSGTCMDGVCIPDPGNVPCPSPAPPSRSAATVTPRSPSPALSVSPVGQPSIVNASPSPALPSVSTSLETALPSPSQSPRSGISASATMTATAMSAPTDVVNPSETTTPIVDVSSSIPTRSIVPDYDDEVDYVPVDTVSRSSLLMVSFTLLVSLLFFSH